MPKKKTPATTEVMTSAPSSAIVAEQPGLDKLAHGVVRFETGEPTRQDREQGKPLFETGASTGSKAGQQAHTDLTFTTRQARALALLRPGHWVTRETFDREAGASNGPDLVQQLRRKLGQDAIETQHFDALDRDGKPCRPGRYRLTDKGRERLAQISATTNQGRAAA